MDHVIFVLHSMSPKLRRIIISITVTTSIHTDSSRLWTSPTVSQKLDITTI